MGDEQERCFLLAESDALSAARAASSQRPEVHRIHSQATRGKRGNKHRRNSFDRHRR